MTNKVRIPFIGREPGTPQKTGDFGDHTALSKPTPSVGIEGADDSHHGTHREARFTKGVDQIP
jgi:hypothetical protein